MRLNTSVTIAAATILLVGVAGGCSSESSSEKKADNGSASTGAPSSADLADFCAAYTGLDDSGNYQKFSAGIADLEKAGAPQDMPGLAAGGFTLYAEIVSATYSVEGAEAAANDVSDEEAKQLAAFKEFIANDC